ncbi:hypothetical protein HYC85_019012 [Camellia sinensis]|uniref:Uncharacterized protein n=1 Tax=Camellia sinensis TaxID=4442 RepID=A0A7J7GXE3_CAMSI|nr:hypothetical protein HYC85_019012 [Camellia sinensis]
MKFYKRSYHYCQLQGPRSGMYQLTVASMIDLGSSSSLTAAYVITQRSIQYRLPNSLDVRVPMHTCTDTI